MKMYLEEGESKSKMKPDKKHPIRPPKALNANVEETAETSSFIKSFRSRRVGPMIEVESPKIKNENQSSEVFHRSGQGYR